MRKQWEIHLLGDSMLQSPAAFLGLVWPRLTGKLERTLAVSSILLAVLLSPIISAGLPIIATALLAAAFGWKVR